MSDHYISNALVRNVEVSDKTIWRHVVLKTDSGLIGTGEASLDNMPGSFDVALRSAAGALEGCRLQPDVMTEFAALLGNGLPQRTIHSALDQGVNDLMAQINSIPLHRQIGGTGTPGATRLYANINRSTLDRSPQGFARNAARAASEGFDAIKIAAFDGLTPALCETPAGHILVEAGLARLEAVAKAAPKADIMVDCHWRLGIDMAHALLPRLADMGIIWLECPYPETYDRIGDLRNLRSKANAQGIRLCGLETFGDWDHVSPFVRGGAYDVIMPDVKHAGSLATIFDIAQRAKRHGVTVSLHNPSGPIAHLVSVHVAAAIGGHERLEIQWRESDLFSSITKPAPDFSDGMCYPGQTSGLGAALMDGIGMEDVSH